MFIGFETFLFAQSQKEISTPSQNVDKNTQKDDSTQKKQDDKKLAETKKQKEGKIVGGIALTVNGDPITLYQIKETQKKLKIDEKQAVNALIAERLKTQEIKRLKINVDDARIDEEMDNIAKQNGMTRDGLIGALMKDGISYSEYRKKLKDQIQTQELLRNILLSNVNMAGETQMRDYYDKHKDEFIVPKKVQTIRYVSSSSSSLQEAMASPSLSVTGVDKGEEDIDIDTLNPQIAQVFIQTPKNNFTPVLNAGGGNYVAFLIKNKIGETEIPYDQAKNFIAQKLVQSNQDMVLNEYFEKIRVKAKINVIRE